MPNPLIAHPEQIITIDTGYLRDGLAASHLVIDSGEAAFIDVGTNSCIPQLLNALENQQLGVDAVRYIILTHIHLDHAGAASQLMQLCPNAKLLVHPRGSRHMAQPEKLIAGVKAVYGEQYDELYGEIVPVDEDRIQVTEDGFVADLGKRQLHFLDTPGHARHHCCIHDADAGVIFSGDTFGLSYRECDTDKGAFIFPSTTPVQFEPDALHDSINRLVALKPKAIFMTHFDRVENVGKLADDLHCHIDALVSMTRKVMLEEGNDKEKEKRLIDEQANYLHTALQDHGCDWSDEKVRDFWAMDLELNAQGLICWAKRH